MKPFKDKIIKEGKEYYSLRMGEQVPPNAVNLAYIDNKELRADENIQILSSASSDIISDAKDNTLILWSDDRGYLYKNISTGSDIVLGDADIYSDTFALSSSFSKASGSITFDDAYVYKYFLRYYYIDINTLDGASGPPFQNRSPLVTILNEDGSQLSDKLLYKITLTKIHDLYRKTQSGNVPLGKSAYIVTIYSNFTSDQDNTYIVRYNKVTTTESDGYYFINSQQNNYTEIFNGVSQMMNVAINNTLQDSYFDPLNTYSIEHKQNGYQIKVSDNHRATNDTRTRQGFWWKLNYNNLETPWHYDEVIDEYDTIDHPAKQLSSKSLVDIMQMYYPNFSPSGAATIIVGTMLNVNGTIGALSQYTDPRSNDKFSVPNTNVVIYFDASNKIVAYTSQPDNTQITATGISRIVTKPMSADIILEAKMYTRWRTANWSNTISSMMVAEPQDGFNNKWKGKYTKRTNQSNYSGIWEDYTITEDVGSDTEQIIFDQDMPDRVVTTNEPIGTHVCQLYLTTYYWVPRDISITNSVIADDNFFIRVNEEYAFSTGITNTWKQFTINLNAGWNKIYIYVDNSSGGRMCLKFANNFSYLIKSSLGATGIVCQNSYQSGEKLWTKVVQGTAEVSTNVDTTKNDAEVGPISAGDIPSNVRSNITWGSEIIVSSGIEVVSGPTITDNKLSFVLRMIDDGYWQDITKTSITATFSEDGTSDGDLHSVIDLKSLYDNIGLSYPQGSREANNLVLSLSSSNPKISVRLISNNELLLDTSDLISEFIGTKLNTYYMYKNLPADLSTVDIVCWSTVRQELLVSKPFAIKINISKTFFLDVPQTKTNKDNWYIRVHNASINKIINLPPDGDSFNQIVQMYPGLIGHAGESISVEYSLPEFDRQYFNGKPIVTVENEEAEQIDEYTIKVKFTPICNYKPIRIEGHTVKDVQSIKGIITLNEPITEYGKRIFATYSYIEEWITYRGYYDGITPYDPGILNTTFWHLDVNPSPHHSITTTELGIPGHLSLNPSFNIDNPSLTETEREGIIRVDKPTNLMMSRPIYVYIYPRSITLNGRKIRNKLGEESASTTIFHTTMPNIFNDPLAISLGKVYIQPNSSLQDMIIIDTRTRGGGLSNTISKAIIDQINIESNYYWDIGNWDGQPYQENAVAYFRIPETLLVKHGGRFTEDEVRENIKKYLALGVLPQIEFISNDEFISEYVDRPDTPSIEIDDSSNTEVVVNITSDDELAQFYIITKENLTTGETSTINTEQKTLTDQVALDGNSYRYSVMSAIWINEEEYISSTPCYITVQR
jgi:hypothetical protein